MLLEEFPRLGCGGGGEDGEVLLFQFFAQVSQDDRLVLDEEDAESVVEDLHVPIK
jgi:hypothetical protein